VNYYVVPNMGGTGPDPVGAKAVLSTVDHFHEPIDLAVLVNDDRLRPLVPFHRVWVLEAPLDILLNAWISAKTSCGFWAKPLYALARGFELGCVGRVNFFLRA
jgi:hypothetical protein